MAGADREFLCCRRRLQLDAPSPFALAPERRKKKESSSSSSWLLGRRRRRREMTSCVVFCLVSAGVHRKSLHSTLAGNGFGHEVSKRVASRDARLKSGRATRGCFYPTGGGLLPKAYRTVTVIVISSSLFACSDPDSSATTAALTPHEWEAQWILHFFLVCFSRGSNIRWKSPKRRNRPLSLVRRQGCQVR